ncbi:MAG: hypothetical protein O7F73_03045 [Gammaproteobacteria bacterium]|nr:hypothetical protein [Gammaproteobacteria bacterium]
MKLPIVTIGLIAVVAALVFGADPIVESILDRKLAPLLTRQLGLPVTLAPIETEVLSLSVRSSRLVMGDPDNPAVEVADVVVGLSWSALLAGDIRLVHAQAADLSVSLSNWPGNDKPRPENYEFLEPWLPKTLHLQAGRYIPAEGEPWSVRELEWQRHSPNGASLAWSENRALAEIRFSAELASLPDLLGLKDFDLEIEITAADTVANGAVLELAVKPGETGGYRLLARADNATTQLRLSAGSAVPWQFPDYSDIYLSQLRPEVVVALMETFSRESEGTDFEASLLVALPRLKLPPHRGHMEIGEIRLDDEVVVDTFINFSTGAQGLSVDSVTSQGPSAALEGAGSLEAVDDSWSLRFAAELNARQASESIAARVLDADWHWRSGRIQLQGDGDTPGELLDSLQGDLLLLGTHRGEVDTPLKIQGRLGKHPDFFALEELEIKMGTAVLEGSVAFSGGRERQLKVRLEGQSLDLNFLFDGTDAAPMPGIKLPEYLGLFPEVEVDVVVAVRDLQTPRINLAKADFALDRKPTAGRLVVAATGIKGGKTEVQLDFETSPNSPTTVTMTVDLAAMDLPRAFAQERGLFDTRATGNMVYTSHGNGVAEIFGAMRGNADLTIALRTDADWNRPSRPEEELRFSGTSSLVIDGDRIKGLYIKDINIDTVKQDLSGDISVVAGREPWLIARLQSDRLDISQLLEWAPETPEDADAADLLTSLRELGQVQLSFAADIVEVLETQLQDVVLEISSDRDHFVLERLDLSFEGSRLEGRAVLDWEGELAEFLASATVTDILLDDFLNPDSAGQGMPLSGSIELAGQGTHFAEIASSLSAQLNLKAQPEQGALRRQLQVDLQRLRHGVRADIKSLAWNDSELRGRVLYQNSSPPLLEVDITGGTLNLEPWEGSGADTTPVETMDDGGTPFSRAARTTSLVVSKLLTVPSQLLSSSAQASTEGRYFSDERMDTTFLIGHETHIKGQLAAVFSREGTAKDLEFDVNIVDGKLNLKTRAGYLNGGTIEIKLDFDTAPELPTAALTVSFKDVYRTPQLVSSPRTGFIAVTSRGRSQAELAAHLNGVTYVELGRGPINYGSMSLLTTDVASGVFRALIPGAAKKEPELRCGITLGKFTDGIGITPYGYAARTDTANLMGQIEVNFRKQELSMRFQSRSREGIGLSLGNAFSNTVSIRGPLSNPAIVPNTTGLLFRGWAAFMTAGMSMLGESMINRALASTNPCNDIRNAIRKDLCTSEEPVAESPLVCPP